MARRRSEDGFPDDFGDDDGLGGLLGGMPNEGGPGIGGIFEDAPPLDIGKILQPPNKPPSDPTPPDGTTLGIPAYGNTDRPRDLAGPQSTPNTFGLPQGVSVNEGMFSGVPQSGNSMNVPGQSRTPRLSSGNVMNAPPESGTSQGPMRRSASSPSIYGESASPTMFGRAGGLLGGGKGLVGAEESSGPIAPTKMMAKLLQLFRQQGSM